MPSLTVSLALFLSTPSARRATGGALQRHTRQGYFYPRPPRGGRHSPCVAWEQGHSISIHVLREEGDSAPVLLGRLLHNFYPRPPRGGRLIAKVLAGRCAIFLSTPSARRATTVLFRICAVLCNFYPRPPRGGRRGRCARHVAAQVFLSTPSARRATTGFLPWTTKPNYFYPRPPRGGRPVRAT